MFAELSSLIIDSLSETNIGCYRGTDVSDEPATAICRRLNLIFAGPSGRAV